MFEYRVISTYFPTRELKQIAFPDYQTVGKETEESMGARSIMGADGCWWLSRLTASEGEARRIPGLE